MFQYIIFFNGRLGQVGYVLIWNLIWRNLQYRLLHYFIMIIKTIIIIEALEKYNNSVEKKLNITQIYNVPFKSTQNGLLQTISYSI